MLLIVAVLAQSLLTVVCDLDNLAARQSAHVVVAGDLHAPSAAADAGICPNCGGFATTGGCCAHGLALASNVPQLFAAKPLPLLPIAAAADQPRDAPSDLFRPPIPA